MSSKESTREVVDVALQSRKDAVVTQEVGGVVTADALQTSGAEVMNKGAVRDVSEVPRSEALTL